MSIAKVTEVISSSEESFEHAIKEGVKRASKTLKNVKSVWVKDQNALVDDGRVTEFRVTMMVTFVLDD